MSEPVQNPDAGEARERNSRETQPQEPADAQDTAETQPSGTVNRYQSLALLGSSVLAAASTLVVTMIAQRALTGSELTEFLLFWSALFTVTGVITGLQPEITRAPWWLWRSARSAVSWCTWWVCPWPPAWRKLAPSSFKTYGRGTYVTYVPLPFSLRSG